jgi:hypothetical protein
MRAGDGFQGIRHLDVRWRIQDTDNASGAEEVAQQAPHSLLRSEDNGVLNILKFRKTKFEAYCRLAAFAHLEGRRVCRLDEKEHSSYLIARSRRAKSWQVDIDSYSRDLAPAASLHAIS